MLASERRRWFAVVVVFVSSLGISYLLLSAQATCGDGPTVSRACVAFELLRDFQTIVAALVALAAAVVAVRPVYRQLLAMHVQNELAARRVVADRLARIEARTAENLKDVGELHREMQRKMDHDLTEFDSTVSEVYASDMAGSFHSAIGKLRAAQDERLGTSRIEEARSTLIDRTSDLARCLHLIGVPGWICVDEDHSEEDIQAASESAERAETELYDCWFAVNAALREFRDIALSEQDRLRRRIRRIDDMIADQPGT